MKSPPPRRSYSIWKECWIKQGCPWAASGEEWCGCDTFGCIGSTYFIRKSLFLSIFPLWLSKLLFCGNIISSIHQKSHYSSLLKNERRFTTPTYRLFWRTWHLPQRIWESITSSGQEPQERWHKMLNWVKRSVSRWGLSLFSAPHSGMRQIQLKLEKIRYR